MKIEKLTEEQELLMEKVAEEYEKNALGGDDFYCLLYTSPSPRD